MQILTWETAVKEGRLQVLKELEAQIKKLFKTESTKNDERDDFEISNYSEKISYNYGLEDCLKIIDKIKK